MAFLHVVWKNSSFHLFILQPASFFTLKMK